MLKVTALALVALFLGACVTNQNAAEEIKAEEPKSEIKEDWYLEYQTMLGLMEDAESEAEVRAIFKSVRDQYPVEGTTYLFFDTGHGFQVSYLGPDGRGYLWYPGNGAIVTSAWKTEDNGNRICFRYGERNYNPVTKEWGGKWKCRPTKQFRPISGLPGNFYAFRAEGAVPYVRDDCDVPKEFKPFVMKMVRYGLNFRRCHASLS